MQTTFAQELDHIYGELFMAECARLAETCKDLSDEELEMVAENNVIKYLYEQEKKLLSYYLNSTNWRRGWE